MSKKRINHAPAFKAKVALAAIKQEKTLSQLAAQFKIHPTAISKWKAQLLENAHELFAEGRAKKSRPETESDTAPLFEKIGRLEVENDFLKKKVRLVRLTPNVMPSNPTIPT